MGQHGGSKPGKSRNLPRDFDAAVQNMMKDYFSFDGEPPLYTEAQFERRFRLPCCVFNIIYNVVRLRPEFERKSDATGKQGLHPLQRIVAEARVLSYGVAGDATDEYSAISETSVKISLM